MSDSSLDKIAKLLDERDALKARITELEVRLSQYEGMDNPEYSPELNIAEMELKRLQDKAVAGSLSLEDTKKYDLLVKNKRLAKEKSTSNTRTLSPREVNIIELTKIAGGHVIDEEQDYDKDEH